LRSRLQAVWTDKRFNGLRLSDYDAYLSDDLRIARQSLDKLDCSRLQVIAMAYDSVKIDNLVRYLKCSKEAPHAPVAIISSIPSCWR